jgi:hypothetical protein
MFVLGRHHIGFKMLLGYASLTVVTSTGVGADSTFKFFERLSTQLICNIDDNNVATSCQPFQTGHFKLTVAVPDSETDPSQFTAATPINIAIGGFTFTGTLGDDPKYTAGKSVARIPLTDQTCDGPDCATFTHGFILLKLTRTGVKMTVSTRTTADVHASPSAFASNYIDDEAGVISDVVPSAISIQVGDHSASTNLAVSATVKQLTTSALGTEYSLGNVRLSGFPE